uniref:Alpha-N-acetylneuraminide alpha-2,8-sialyltransferase n=1 Tax=Equus caballus TaxID=9796 RepID=A0A3Q2I369_HORSE
MSPCGRARRHTSRGAMAVLAWKFPRTRLPVGASALCVVVLCWLYIFPVYRLPNEKEIVQGVLQQGTAWRRNQTAARVFRITRRLDGGEMHYSTQQFLRDHRLNICVEYSDGVPLVSCLSSSLPA